MTDIIIHKHSTTSGDAPEPAELSLGELAIQAADGHIYLKKTDGTINRVTMLPGGTQQQVLYKTEASDYALGWGTISSSLLGSTLYGEVTSYVDTEFATFQGTATTKTAGAVTITAGTPSPVSVTLTDTNFIENSTNIRGVLGAIYGTLERDSSGNYAFTADEDPGSNVVIASGTRFAVVVAPSGLGYAINERVSYKPQRSYFRSGEIFGAFNATDGAAVATPTWSINGSGHLIINDDNYTPGSQVYRYWKTGHYWEGNNPIRVNIKGYYTTETNTNGISVLIGETGNSFLYAKNGAIGIFDSAGGPVINSFTTASSMAYAAGEIAEMQIDLNPDGTGKITAIHPTSGEQLVLGFSGYNQIGEVGPSWRRADAGAVTYFTVKHNYFADEFFDNKYQSNLVFPADSAAEIFGAFNATDGAAVATPTWSINGSGHLIINDDDYTPGSQVYRYWKTGHYWDGKDPIRVNIKGYYTTETNTNGISVLIGETGNSFLYAKNGAIGIFDSVGGTVINSFTTASSMAYAAGEIAEMQIDLNPDGTGKITAIHPTSGEQFVLGFSGYNQIGEVGPSWRRADAGAVTYFTIKYNYFADKFFDLENRLKGVENTIATGLTRSVAAGVDAPSGFTFAPSFRIYKNLLTGLFTTNYTPSRISAVNTYHVNPISGDDATGTGSSANPFATVAKAFAQMNSDGDKATIVLASGEYSYSDVGTIPTPTEDFNLICEGDAPAVLTRASTETSWVQTAGYTDVWEKDITTGAAPTWGWDNEYLDSYGEAIPFVLQSSVADVNANPGSMRVDGTKVYVHTFDSREPDSSVKILRSEAGLHSGTRQFYLENIHFLGGSAYSFRCYDSGEDCVINRCRFSYARSGNVVKVLANRGTTIIAIDSIASYSCTLDGWNYHDYGGTCCDVVEINCIGHHNGLAGGPNNNGSTMHDGGRIIRINGDYSYNQNRNVHDINDGSEVWMLGCQAGDAQIVGGTNYTSANFMFGRDGNTDDIVAFLDSCTSRGGSVTDFAIYEGGTLKVRATDTSSFKSIVQTGTLEGY